MNVDLELDRYCIGCGYNLRGLVSDRCPECGLAATAVGGTQVPWEGRKALGLYRAFVRSCWLATFQIERLRNAMAVAVDAKSAWKFRLTVSLLGALPPAILFWIVICYEGGTGFLSIWDPPRIFWMPPPSPYLGFWEIPLLWSAGATLFFVLPIGFFLTLLLMSGAIRFWLRLAGVPAELRPRAKVLAGYVSAPLALLVIPSIAAGFVWLFNDPNTSRLWAIQSVFILLGIITLVLIALLYVTSTVRFIRAVSHCDWLRLVPVTMGVMLTWLTAPIVGMVLFPMLVGLIWLMIDSLRR
jgi:hypothetical protein